MRGIAMVTLSRIRRRWAGLVAIGLLAALVGGFSTAAVAGLRRSETAADRLIEATLAPDAFVFVNFPGDEPQERLRSAVEGQPNVVATWPLARFIGRRTDTKDWYFPLAGPAEHPGIFEPVMDAGRMPAAEALDEVAITLETARNTGLDLGSRFEMDVYTAEQMMNIAADSEVEPAGGHLEMRVVGVMRSPVDIAMASSDRFMVGSEALYERYGDAVDPGAGVAVRLDDRGAVPEFLDAVTSEFPPGALGVNTNVEAIEAAEPSGRVLRVGVVLLVVVVVGAGLFAVTQTARRFVGQHGDEDETLSAIGFTRADRVASAALSGLVAAGAAAAGSVGLAIALSPLFPLGRPRRLEPDPGVEVNVALLAAGGAAAALVTVGVLAVVTAVEARRRRPAPVRPPSRPMALLSAVAPAPVFMGARLALQGRRGRGGAARNAMGGAAIGVAGLVAAATFASSLDALLTTSRHYGVDFDLSMEVPIARIDERLTDLSADPEIEAVALQWTGILLVGGEPIDAVSIDSVHGELQPVVDEGRAGRAGDEVVLGPRLARDLGVEVGDEIVIGGSGGPGAEGGGPVPEGGASQGEETSDGEAVRVVGTALDPRTVSPTYARSAVVAEETLREHVEGDPTPMIVVRYADGVDRAAKTAELDRTYPWAVMDESYPAPPGELLNVAEVRIVPRLLQWFFAALIIVALANGLLVAGRRHRLTLAVARGIGFTLGQVRATVAAMAATMALGAAILGVPLGLLVGAAVWSRVSDGLDVGLVIGWPVAVVLLAVLGVVVVGTAVALWPAHRATSTPPAVVLRTE